MTVIDLYKQQALNADPKAIQKINFTRHLVKEKQTARSFIIEDVTDNIFCKFILL